MAKKKAELNYARVGEEMDVLLTEIYGRYVAQGSPTKLGGLRFLDVPSAKTFAFEKSLPAEDGEGNLLRISAPFVGDQKVIEKKLKSGPHSKALSDVIVRPSKDVGKTNKYFVEAAYKMETGEWLTDEAISKVAEEERCNGNEAIRLILKLNVLPVASEVMDHFVHLIREFSEDSAIV